MEAIALMTHGSAHSSRILPSKLEALRFECVGLREEGPGISAETTGKIDSRSI
jgi:hypothetical protein